MTTSTTGAGTGAGIGLAAVDLGASSGRVIHGRVGPGVLRMTEVRRFRNGAVTLPDGLYWEVLGLYQDVIAGLRDVARLEGNLQGRGIDSWAVDYGLVNAGGSLLAPWASRPACSHPSHRRAPWSANSPRRCWPRPGCPARCGSPPWAHTTPHRRSSGYPPRTPTSRTSPAAPGGWSVSNSTRRCSARTAGRRTSPTNAASTAPSATCATSRACGCCPKPCAPGNCTATRTASPSSSARPPRSGPAGRPFTPTPEFLPPGDMPSRIATACRESRQRPPVTPAEVVRCVLDSLAATLAARVLDAQRLSGRRVDVIHIVGGGSQNQLLCQLIADAAGLPVIAGPVEATALGNLLVQARTHGALTGDLWALRAQLRGVAETRNYSARSAALR